MHYHFCAIFCSFAIIALGNFSPLAFCAEVQVDLGQVDGDVEYTFHFNNPTKLRIEVLAVSTSCGCQDIGLKSGDVIEPRSSKPFMFRVNAVAAGPVEGTANVEYRFENGKKATHLFRLKATLPELIQTRPARLELEYGQLRVVEVLFLTEGLKEQFLSINSLFDLVNLEQVGATDSSLVFSVKAVDNSDRIRKDAREVIDMHFTPGSKPQRFSIPCQIMIGNSISKKEENE